MNIRPTVVGTPNCQSNLATGLVGWWPLTASTTSNGFAFDYSGMGNHLPVRSAAPAWGQGPDGQTCTKFTTSTQGYELTTALRRSDSLTGVTGEVTLSCWVRLLASIISIEPIVIGDSSGSNYIRISTTNVDTSFSVVIGGVGTNAGFSAGYILAANTWYHLVGTYGPGTSSASGGKGCCRLFINGVLGDLIATSTTKIPSTCLSKGRIYTSAFGDDVIVTDARLYNRALSPSEVGSLYGERRWDIYHPQNIVNGVVKKGSVTAAKIPWHLFQGSL